MAEPDPQALDAASEPASPAASASLPLTVKLGYALPSLASAGLALPIYALMPKFYSDTLLAPLGLIALAIAVARAFDALTDPAMGWLSDRFPTRWGRRRPWIAIGVPLTAVSLIAMFSPPSNLGPAGAASWFGICFATYFLFHTIYFVPYQALGFELSLDYHERTEVFGWSQVCSLLGNMIAGASPILIGSAFSDDPRAGYLLIGLVFGGMLIATFGWMLGVVRERPEFVARPTNPIVPGFRRMLRNRPFVVLLSVFVAQSLTGAIPGTVAPFYIPYVLRPESSTIWPVDELTMLGFTIMGYVGAGVLFTPVWVRLSHRIGKRRAWLLGIVIGIVGGLSFFFVPVGNTPLFMLAVLFTGTNLGSGLLASSIKADVIDYDELLTGCRREAQYASVWAMVPKFVVIPSAALPLAILAAVGYVPNQEQPELVEWTLRALLGLTPAVTGAIAFALLAGLFRMDEPEHARVVEGIRSHARGQAAIDPLTGARLEPRLVAEDEDTAWFLDHFTRGELRRVLAHGADFVLRRAIGLAAGSAAVVAILIAYVFTEVESLTTQPGVHVTVAVVIAGFVLAATFFQLLRMGPARALRRRAEALRAQIALHLRSGIQRPED